jgi:phage terminase small subunit
MGGDEMTKNQKIFVDEYLIDLNATRAYKVAYPKVKNDDTARANASRLLTNANIKAEINKKMKEREKRTEITQDKVIKELANLAFTDRTDIVTITSGRVIIQDFDDLTPEQRACIAGVKETKFGIEVSFYGKEKALEMLGRHLGMFNDKMEIKGEIKTNNPFSNLTTEELKKVIFGDK